MAKRSRIAQCQDEKHGIKPGGTAEVRERRTGDRYNTCLRISAPWGLGLRFLRWLSDQLSAQSRTFDHAFERPAGSHQTGSRTTRRIHWDVGGRLDREYERVGVDDRAHVHAPHLCTLLPIQCGKREPQSAHGKSRNTAPKVLSPSTGRGSHFQDFGQRREQHIHLGAKPAPSASLRHVSACVCVTYSRK